MENNKNILEFEGSCHTSASKALLSDISSPNYAQELIDYINTESKTNSEQGDSTLFKPTIDNMTTFSPAPNALFVTSQDVLSQNAWKILLRREGDARGMC